MPLFADVSIQTKLRRITLLATAVALTLAGIAFVVHELFTFRSVMTRELSSMADVIGTNSQAALAFNDAQGAQQTLQALQADSRILVATLYTKEGAPLATYRRKDLEDRQDLQGSPIPVSLSAEVGSVEGRRLQIARPIVLDRERIGTIAIQMDMSEVMARLVQYVIIVVAVLFLSSLLVLLLTGQLQRVIVQPILHLVAIARTVSEQRDYSIRAAQSSRDELGQLIDGFNEMLTQIQTRDAALQEAHGQLEERVKLRTAELEREIAERKRAEEALAEINRALEESHRRLQELDRVKSDFLLNVSHELRTPLTAIKGSVDNMLDGITGPPSEPQRRYLLRVKANADRLVRLINDLLDLARIEEGRVQVTPTFFSLSGLASELLDTLRPVAAEKGLALQFADATDLLIVHADRDKVGQVLMNFLGNAIKFTPSGGIVNIELLEEESFARVQISDTGEGISPEELPHIFDKFYQVQLGIQAKAKGTGLGLSIAKSLVELQGGRIWVKSQIGQGSMFAFTLPRRPLTEACEAPTLGDGEKT